MPRSILGADYSATQTDHLRPPSGSGETRKDEALKSPTVGEELGSNPG